VQGYADEHFPKRMFVYFYRILDRFDKPVTSLAILTDDYDHFHPEKYEIDFLGSKMTYRFNTYKLSKKTADDFANKGNIFSLIMESAWLGLAKNRRGDEALYNQAIQLKRKWLDGGFPKEKIRKALQFLAYYLTFDKPEISLKLKQEMQTTQMTLGIEELVKEHLKQEYLQEGIQKGEKLGIQKGEKLGIQKGEKIGIQKGIKLSVETMLQKGFEPAFIAEALSLNLALVLEIEKELNQKKRPSRRPPKAQ
jgi:hypothetical protein